MCTCAGVCVCIGVCICICAYVHVHRCVLNAAPVRPESLLRVACLHLPPNEHPVLKKLGCEAEKSWGLESARLLCTNALACIISPFPAV